MAGENTKDIFALAVKCRLITTAQETALLDTYDEKQAAGTDCTAEDLFKETGLLSDEDIRFLFSIRSHLQVKMLDKRFGELGIANKLISPESVQDALDRQSAIFKETQESKLLGDILYESQQISLPDKTAILLTQDRIEDEYLSEALNDIASSEIERISLNMRLGAIAVKKGLITIEQLNQALQVQKEEAEAGNPRRYLGEIFKELFGISDEDLAYILKIQKELEKKRLALESAVSRYYSEANTNKRLARIFDYQFSKNKLEAHVRKTQNMPEPVQVPEFISWLNSIGITTGIIPNPEIQAFLDNGKKGAQICIARGTPPQMGKNETIEFFFDTSPVDPEAPEDTLPLVREGDVLARVSPPEEGTPGTDVCGFSVPAPKPRLLPVNSGQGVTRQNGMFVADTDGIATLYKKRTLFVQPRTKTIPVRTHSGAIDSDLSEEYQDTVLKVDGSILASGRVRCQRLEVSEDLLGQVFAAGEIHVKGDIGREKEGDPPAKLIAEGNIFANKQIINAVIATAGGLKAPNADLISSRVTAFEDVVVKNILADKTNGCTIQIGTHSGLAESPFDESIKTRRKELEKLIRKSELAELDKHFNAKLSAKDEYLGQHQILGFFLALLACDNLSRITSLRAKLEAVRKRPDAYKDLPPVPEDSLKAGKKFLPGFYEEIKALSPGEKEAKIREMQDLKYGMYRAAVNASRRHHHEYKHKKKAILKKIKASGPIIRQAEARLRSLKSQRDSFMLRREAQPLAAAPAILVKNKVERGTVIKGRKATLTVDKDIYGVKFIESQKTKDEPPRILIEGYYQ